MTNQIVISQHQDAWHKALKMLRELSATDTFTDYNKNFVNGLCSRMENSKSDLSISEFNFTVRLFNIYVCKASKQGPNRLSQVGYKVMEELRNSGN